MGCKNSKKKNAAKHFSSKRMFQKYTIDRIIGAGISAKIRLAYETGPNKKNKVAIKYLPKTNIRSLEEMKEEVKILQKLDHPNIVKYYEMYEDEGYIYLVMEYCPGGELFDLIANQKVPFKETTLKPLIRQLLLGISHCHAHEIAHRDIKPENILLGEHPEELKSEIKIIDFGLSKEWGGNELRTAVGTCNYTAPEMLEGRYTRACDIWSIGIIFYVLLSLKLPFAGSTIPQVVENIKSQCAPSMDSGVWESISQQAKSLLCRMLRKDPNTRITAQQALCDEWLIDDTQGEGEEMWAITSPRSRAISPHIYRRLRTYHPQTSFQRQAMATLCRRMNTYAQNELTRAFTQLDRNNTGLVSRDELLSAVQDAGIHMGDGDVDQIILNVDSSGNKMINYTEFLAATLQLHEIVTDERLFELFKYFDTDSQGFISEDNIREVMEQAGKPISDMELANMIQLHHTVTPGKINFEEFKLMMQQLAVD